MVVKGVRLLGNSDLRGVWPAACCMKNLRGFYCGFRGWASSRGYRLGACSVAQAVVHHLSLAVGDWALHAEVRLVQALEEEQQCVWEMAVLAANSTMKSRRSLWLQPRKES